MSRNVLNRVLIPTQECRGIVQQIALQKYWFRCIMRGATANLLQQKNFGPNVVSFVLGTDKYFSVVIIAFQKMHSLRSLLLRRVQRYYNNNVVLVARGSRKPQFQQWTSTHSGAGEKETLNINVVGKTSKTSNTSNITINHSTDLRQWPQQFRQHFNRDK